MTKIVGLFCVVAYLLCGCTLNKTPSNRTTFDGLELVKSNGKQQQVWAYPGVDLSSYKSIVFRGAGIQFRPAKRTSLLRPDQTDFFISEENRQTLLQIANNLETVIPSTAKDHMSKSTLFFLKEILHFVQDDYYRCSFHRFCQP